MSAVQLVGHGGLDMLRYRGDVPAPVALAGEVLIRVAAAGVNNTDINTRIGWYSKTVGDATGAGGADGFDRINDADAGWLGAALDFPRIQGADCCGRIVAVGEGVDCGRIGERVIVRNMLRSPVDYRPYECWTLGSECDGAFAQYVKAPPAKHTGSNAIGPTRSWLRSRAHTRRPRTCYTAPRWGRSACS